MEEPEYATVLMRIKLGKTVGELKADLTAEVSNNLYIDGRKLPFKDDEETLVGAGIVPNCTITNSPTPLSQNNIPSTKLCHGPLSANNLVKLIFGILIMVRFPKPTTESNGSLPLLRFPAVFASIMSQLDPVSFLRLSSTCRRIRGFALSKKDRILVPFPCKIVKTWRGLRLKWMKNGEGYRTINVYTLRSLSKYPFKFVIKVLFRLSGLTTAGINAVSNFVDQMGSFAVDSIIAKEFGGHRQSSVNCWNELAEFIFTFNVKKFNYDGFTTDEAFAIISSTDVEEIEIYGWINPNMISGMKFKSIILQKSEITANYFKYLVQELAFGRLEQLKQCDLYDYHDELHDAELYKRCFNGILSLDFDHQGPLPETRPIAFIEDDYNVTVITVNDIAYGFARYHNVILFGKWEKSEVDDAPPAVRALIQ